MLIGAHVSTAGGLDKVIERGIETRSDAIQIFNQSPRMWRPTNYSDEECADFRDAMRASPVQQVAIHAVYLIHTPTVDPEVRRKSQASLIHSLRLGDRIGSTGVVLHAGSRKDAPMSPALRRSAKMIGRALAESDSCRILLENTAGSKGNLGRDFDELAALLDACGADARIGFCLDCCHLLASGYEIRSDEALSQVVDEFDSKLGLDRLHCLHVNDSAIPLGGNRDKHADLGKGELGRKGLAVFLSEPRFEDMPALLEVPGMEGIESARKQVLTAKRLRREGLRARAW